MTFGVAGGAKSGVDDLALFGGRPLFDSARSIGQFFEPPLEDFLSLLRPSYESHKLTDGGRIVAMLEERLAAFHAVRNCVAVANAGIGLMMLMQIFARGRRGDVIMPAFTFRGLPHFARWAGQQPRFCDVDERTHALDPKALARIIDDRTTSVLAVCNFNSPGDIAELCRVADARGVPLFFDSVYAIGSTYGGRPLGGFGRAEVYSLHATKLVNGFEGGYVTTDDDSLAAILRWQRTGTPPPNDISRIGAPGVVGLNANLNEMHAAMAYCCFERIEEVIAGNRSRYEAYGKVLNQLPGLRLVPYPETDRERSNYELAIVELSDSWPLARDEMVTLLRAEHVIISGYFSTVLHRSPDAPPGQSPVSLPVSEGLARRFLQLPVGELLSMSDIGRIGGLFEFLLENGTDVAARMRAKAAS